MHTPLGANWKVEKEKEQAADDDGGVDVLVVEDGCFSKSWGGMVNASTWQDDDDDDVEVSDAAAIATTARTGWFLTQDSIVWYYQEVISRLCYPIISWGGLWRGRVLWSAGNRRQRGREPKIDGEDGWLQMLTRGCT